MRCHDEGVFTPGGGQDHRDLGAEVSRTFRELLGSLTMMRESLGAWPGASSPAMDELRFEVELKGPPPWGDDPVVAARNLAVALSVAAADHARSFADAVERYAPYAPAASARAAAEVCGEMAWLCQPGVGARERVRRMTNERLRSFADELKAVRRVPALAAREQQVTDTIADLRRTATTLGYPVNRVYLAPDPPGMGELVANLFAEDVGGLMYHLMSSTSHGRIAGMMRSVVADPALAGLIGPRTGRISLQPHDAAVQASAVLIALQVGVGALAAYSGWDRTDWGQHWTAAAVVADTARRHFEPGGPTGPA
jgi:hypothetical protein